MESGISRALVLLNTTAGTAKSDYHQVITNWLRDRNTESEFVFIPGDAIGEKLRGSIKRSRPDVLIAVGGDGTVNLATSVCMEHDLPLCIIPTGSANGMARELQIPEDPTQALAMLEKSNWRNCDVVTINNRWLSLHLCDMGLNARIIKYFDEGVRRGWRGYAAALVKAMRRRRKIKVMIETREGPRSTEAVMVIIANASRYGTGATINPSGMPDDGLFEVVVMKKLHFLDLIKMFFGPRRFNKNRIEIFQARKVSVECRRPSHFQVDGEFIGKLNGFEARILPGKIRIAVP